MHCTILLPSSPPMYRSMPPDSLSNFSSAAACVHAASLMEVPRQAHPKQQLQAPDSSRHSLQPRLQPHFCSCVSCRLLATLLTLTLNSTSVGFTPEDERVTAPKRTPGLRSTPARAPEASSTSTSSGHAPIHFHSAQITGVTAQARRQSAPPAAAARRPRRQMQTSPPSSAHISVHVQSCTIHMASRLRQGAAAHLGSQQHVRVENSSTEAPKPLFP